MIHFIITQKEKTVKVLQKDDDGFHKFYQKFAATNVRHLTVLDIGDIISVL